MSNLKRELEECYKNVDISEYESDIMLNNILNKYDKRKKTKRIVINVTLIFVLMLASAGLGITYADELKDSFNTIVSKIVHDRKGNMEEKHYSLRLESSTKKELNYTAKLDEPKCVSKMDRVYGLRNSKCYVSYTRDEINDILGIKLLNLNNKKTNDYVLYKVLRDENNNIKHLDFRISNLFQIFPDSSHEFSEKNGLIASIRAIVLTKYIDDNIYWDYSIDANASIEEYFIKNLNTTAYITDYPEDKGILLGKERKIILFMYDDIGYRLDVTSLYDENEGKEAICNMLENLSY